MKLNNNKIAFIIGTAYFVLLINKFIFFGGTSNATQSLYKQVSLPSSFT